MSKKESNFKKIETNAFLVIFQWSSLSCKTVMLRNGFPLKHLSMANGNVWSYCVARTLLGYICLWKKDTGYHKEV